VASTGTDPHTGLDNELTDALLRARRFFTRADVSDDLRTVTRRGGRQGDVFYRDRWSHDKVVRSTHGVNCTGSCSWKIYVKDGIISTKTLGATSWVGTGQLTGHTAAATGARSPSRSGSARSDPAGLRPRAAQTFPTPPPVRPRR